MIWQGLRRRWRALIYGDWGAGLFGRLPVSSRVRWFGAETEGQAIIALAAWAKQHQEGAVEDGWVLSLGEGDDFHQRLNLRLDSRGIDHRPLSLEQVLDLPEDMTQQATAVLCAYLDVRRQTQAARKLANHPILGARPFEYIAGLDSSVATLSALDEYAETDFVSPVLLDEPTPYEIYRESLQHFEQKCGLRDFLDLYQLLKSVIDNQVPGDIAEFGSYKGHSGWLIARSLQALGSDKRLYLFDTFESFPAEAYGVDHFWSETHQVDFEAVQEKFQDWPNATLVRGDFTATLADSPVDRLALAYIDCDSYRASRYLLEVLPENHISAQGILVCEDYGHPALLGNRVAVHEALDGRPGWFCFFSQFSGLYIALRHR